MQKSGLFAGAVLLAVSVGAAGLEGSWSKDAKAAFAEAQRTGRPVLVVFR